MRSLVKRVSVLGVILSATTAFTSPAFAMESITHIAEEGLALPVSGITGPTLSANDFTPAADAVRPCVFASENTEAFSPYAQTFNVAWHAAPVTAKSDEPQQVVELAQVEAELPWRQQPLNKQETPEGDEVAAMPVATLPREEKSDDVFDTAALADSDLDTQRGTFTPESLGVAVFNATTVNTMAEGGKSGDNVIGGNAFGNSQGVVTLIQNSGNNVIIQSATIVNLTLSAGN